MKKLFMLVLLAVLAACGAPSDLAPEGTEVPATDVVYMVAPIGSGGGIPPIVSLPPNCPVPCCGNSVTFFCGESIAMAPAGSSVPINSTLMVAFSEAQTPNYIRVLVSPKVNCSWVWRSDNKQVNCTPNSITAFSGLAYSTTYTLTAQRWSVDANGVGSWTNRMTKSFTTEAKPILIFR